MPIEPPKSLSKAAISVLHGFLTRNPDARLGAGPNGKHDIMNHAFFHTLDWVKLERREIRPPIKMNIKVGAREGGVSK